MQDLTDRYDLITNCDVDDNARPAADAYQVAEHDMYIDDSALVHERTQQPHPVLNLPCMLSQPQHRNSHMGLNTAAQTCCTD